ncbi:TerB family tellurite resistance protein [Kitasatospora sp. NPDC096147]|uniref:TerB family tellurite resistance protein n=1 Tax=Kitasatospora sp. NPDC096147 TaxID=3364093 RepID=UPI0038300368
MFGTPVLPVGPVTGCVQCTTCHRRFGLEALDQLTCVRLAAMLRDAQYTVALAVLAAGGTAARAARDAACEAIREAGFEDCGEAQVLAALAALSGVGGDTPLDLDTSGSGLTVELHAALEPLAPHLAQPGRERLVLQGAWIALADGRYLPHERTALAAVGRCLDLPAARTEELLEVATRTTSH